MLTNDQTTALLNALPDPAFVLTGSGRYAAIYGGIDKRYYHDGTSLVGRSLGDVLVPEKADWFLGEIAKALASPQALHVVEYGLSGQDVKGLTDEGPAQEIWFEGRVQALDFQVDGEDAVLWVASNITMRHELELQLRRSGETDPLTELANRRRLLAEFDENHHLFKRYGTQLSLLVFDIDNFKQINDELGHDIGDRVLVRVAAVCREEIRNTDVAARLGGDEFVILLPHTALGVAARLAERLRSQIERVLKDVAVDGRVTTISGGLTYVLPTDSGFESVFKRADGALYQAKSKGRNRIFRVST